MTQQMEVSREIYRQVRDLKPGEQIEAEVYKKGKFDTVYDLTRRGARPIRCRVSPVDRRSHPKQKGPSPSVKVFITRE